MIALDTNLLVYAHRAAVPEHRAAREAIERAAAHPWGFSLACVVEFWSVATHRAAAGRPSRPQQAARFLEELILAGAVLWMPGPAFASRLMQLAVDLGVAGPRIFDVQIGLMAFEGGAREIWTHDRAFVPVPGLRVVHPF